MNDTKRLSVVCSSGTLVLLVLSFVLLAAFGLRTIGNTDFWSHLAQGRLIAEQHLPSCDQTAFTTDKDPITNFTWLYDRTVYAMWQMGGASLVILSHVAMVVLAFLLLLPVAARIGGALSMVFALLMSGWLLSLHFTIQSQSFMLWMPALFILMLTVVKDFRILAVVLIPAQLLWTNMDTRFWLGPVLCVLFGLEAFLVKAGDQPVSQGFNKKTMSFLLLAVATLVASFINPKGPGIYGALFAMWGDPTVGFLQEWISPFSGQFANSLPRRLLTFALLVGAAGLITERKKLPVVITTLAVATAFMVVRSLWHLESFALLGFVFFVLSFNAFGQFLAQRFAETSPEKKQQMFHFASIVAALLIVWSLGLLVTNRFYNSIGSASVFGLGVEEGIVPSASANVIGHPAFPAMAVNQVPDGGYLSWKYPDRQIFIDQRIGVYKRSTVEMSFKSLLSKDDSWGLIETNYAPNAVILNCSVPNSSQIVRSLLVKRMWALAYFDGTTAILLRNVSDNKGLLDSVAIRQEGLQVLEQERKDYADRAGGFIRPRVPARLIGAGNLFYSLGRYEEARAVFSLLVKGVPNYVPGWMGLGVSLVETGHAADGIPYLETAVSKFPGNALGWFWLSKAYRLAGDTVNSDAAMEKGTRLKPELAAAFDGSGPAKPTIETEE